MKGSVKMILGKVIPMFRMFDEHKAKEFYLDFLDFKLDWEHRFENDLPLYMQVSRDHFTLHLTEHYGDCSPGSAIRVAIEEPEVYHNELLGKRYKYLRPEIEITEWNTKEMCLIDPFGNKLIFFEEIKNSTK